MLYGDIWIQLERRGSVSNITKPFIAILVINILLWVDFNLTILRRQKRQSEPPTSRLRFVQGPSWLPRPRRMTLLVFRRLEASLETTVELLGEDPATFVLMTPILCSVLWGR